MAITAIRPVVCAACGHKQSVLDVRQINAEKRPALKEKILQGTLFPMRCNHCGAELEQAQRCLYIDPRRPLFLELSASGQALRLPEIQESLKGMHAVFRLVRTPEDMAEKLRIFDSGLDDRAVEIIRLLMITQLGEQDPALLETRPAFAVVNGEPQLSCLCTDGTERVCPITKTLYQSIAGEYLKSGEEPGTGELLIDGAWVYRLLAGRTRG